MLRFLSELVLCVYHFKVIRVWFIHSILFHQWVVEVSVHRGKSTSAGNQLCEENGRCACGLRNDEKYLEGDWHQWLPKLVWPREALEKLLLSTHLEPCASCRDIHRVPHTCRESGTQNLRRSHPPHTTICSWESSLSEYFKIIFLELKYLSVIVDF